MVLQIYEQNKLKLKLKPVGKTDRTVKTSANRIQSACLSSLLYCNLTYRLRVAWLFTWDMTAFRFNSILPRDAMLARYMLSSPVRLSVRSRYCVETPKISPRQVDRVVNNTRRRRRRRRSSLLTTPIRQSTLFTTSRSTVTFELHYCDLLWICCIVAGTSSWLIYLWMFGQ